jgi:hypothetical protein
LVFGPVVFGPGDSAWVLSGARPGRLPDRELAGGLAASRAHSAGLPVPRRAAPRRSARGGRAFFRHIGGRDDSTSMHLSKPLSPGPLCTLPSHYTMLKNNQTKEREMNSIGFKIASRSVFLAVASSSLLACIGAEEDQNFTTAEEEEEIPDVEPPDRVVYGPSPMSVTWQKIGYPFNANKIAACPNSFPQVIYALNDDYSLWKGNGNDNGWTYRGYPGNARDISCTGSSWIWALNSDKRFYYNVQSGNDTAWVYEGTAGSADQIGSSDMLSALNVDDSVRTYDNSTKLWTYKATFPGATEVANAKNRWFVVVGGNVNYTSGSSLALTPIPITVGGVKQNVRDISAPAPDLVFALTENRELFKAVFTELSCTDGIDNDGDSLADGYDPDCQVPLGTSLCSLVAKSGNFCISRMGVASNMLAVCNGSTLVSTQGGGWCTTVGTGGSDYLGWL